MDNGKELNLTFIPLGSRVPRLCLCVFFFKQRIHITTKQCSIHINAYNVEQIYLIYIYIYMAALDVCSGGRLLPGTWCRHLVIGWS